MPLSRLEFRRRRPVPACRRLENTQPNNRRSRCASLPTATGQGCCSLDGGPDAADPSQLPLVPALEENPDSWTVQDTFRDLPMDAVTLLENVLDVSHVPFTHHKTVGKRENAAPVEASITGEDASGFTAHWEEGPRRGKLGAQSTTFHAPQLMWHDLTAKGFGRILTVVYAVPIRRGECRLFARFPFQFQSAVPRLLIGLRPRWLQHIGNHKVLEDDQVFLHWQERVLERAGGSPAVERSFFMPTTADVYVAALHRWLNANGGEPFAGQPLPPRQSTTALMDRYNSHTIHCRSCSSALKRIRAARPWAWALLWGSAVLVGIQQGSGWSSTGLVTAALSALALRQLNRWEQGLTIGSGAAPATADQSPGTGSKVGFTLPWMSTLPPMVTLLSTDTSARTASGSSAVTDTAPSTARGAFPRWSPGLRSRGAQRHQW